MVKDIIFSKIKIFLFEFFSLFEKSTGSTTSPHLLLHTPWEKYVRQVEILENIFALFPYEEPKIRATILEIKTTGNPVLADSIVKEMYEAFLPELSRLEELYAFSPTIVPTPLFKEDLNKKGFNHAKEIARSFAIYSNYLLDENVIIKSRKTLRQHDLSKKERLWNLTDAFSVIDERKVSGKDFLLIDDVTTTGETLLELSNTLRRAGARLVVAVALAH